MPASASAIPDEYRADVARAVEICKAEGCQEIFILGSAAAGRHRSQSDLDIAVRGCPPKNFYRLLGRLMDELTHPVDLVDLDTEIRVAEFLEREDQLVHVG